MGVKTFLGKPPVRMEKWIKRKHRIVPDHTIITMTDGSTKEIICESGVLTHYMTKGENTNDRYKQNTTFYMVEIGRDVNTIDDSAFYFCTSLTTAIIPDNVVIIDSHAFSCCWHLSSIILSKNLTRLDYCAIEASLDLTHVTIPESVTEIREAAFNMCRNLRSVDLNITNQTIISGRIFFNCLKLTEVNCPNITKNELLNYQSSLQLGITSYGILAVTCHCKDGILILNENVEDNTPEHTIITYEDDTTNEIVCSDGTLTWEMTKGSGNQTAENITIKSVKIGYDVSVINDYAFYNCTGLTTITLHKQISLLGTSAFENCSSLLEISFLINPNSITIGERAFYNCTALHTVTLSPSVVEIKNQAFCNCVKLYSVIITGDTIILGNEVYSNCITIRNVEFQCSKPITLNNNIFYGCSNLSQFSDPYLTISEIINYQPQLQLGILPNGTNEVLCYGLDGNITLNS